MEATKFRIIDILAPIDVGIVDQDTDANASQDNDVRPSEFIDNDVESHADSVAIEDTCAIDDNADKNFAAKSNTSCNRRKPAGPIQRYCPKCKMIEVDVAACITQLCSKCETPMTYQCRCDKQCSSYESFSKHRFNCSIKIIHSCDRCKFTTKYKSHFRRHMQVVHKVADESTTTRIRRKHLDLIKRYCPKCEKLVEDVSVCKKELCTECDTPITYQCARCDKQYCIYRSLIYHLNRKCNPQNLDLKCTECDYRTHAKYLLRQHKKRCSSRFTYSCSQCEFKSQYQDSIRRHMQGLHKVLSGDNCSIAVETEKSLADESTTTGIRQKYAGLIKRYCPKCEKLVEDAYIHKKLLCTECDTLTTYQCARCDKQFCNYHSMIDHLNSKCYPQNLDLKCPVCDYRTHMKRFMTSHLNLCLIGIIFSCGLCEYAARTRQELFRHMFTVHKDIFNVDCSQCKTKCSKCKRCQNMVHFCETCHTGFSSTDKFQEHQKSCKQPVLECKFCPYKTDVNSELRKHIKLQHWSGLISQAMPTQD